MIIVFTAVIASLIATNPEQGLAMAFTMMLMLADVFQISFGIFKIGHFVTLMPYIEVSWLLSIIRLILNILQVSPLLDSAPPAVGITGTLSARLLLSSITLTGLALAILTFCVLIYTPKQLQRYLPPQLLALALGTIVSIFILSDEIHIIDEILTGLPSKHMPGFNWSHWQTILVNPFVRGMLTAL